MAAAVRIFGSVLAALALSAPVADAAPPIVPFDQGKASAGAEIEAATFRIQVLTPTLIRLEYAEDGVFEDRPTMTAIDRRLPAPRFETARREGKLTIETKALTLSYEPGSGPFGPENLSLTRSIGADAETVNLDPAANPPSLGGWRRSLDLVSDEVPLHPGLLSRGGWHLLDDSSTVLLVPGRPGFAIRPDREGAYQDLYLFAYGHDYPRALRDLRALTGPAPLLERKTFGVWFSRYWPYSAEEFRAIVARFGKEEVPLDTISLDTDWKRVNDPVGAAIAATVAGQDGKDFSWNGWEWNSDLFPDPSGFIDWAHEQGLALTLNIHPSIDSRDPRFAEAQMRAGGGLAEEEEPACRILQADTQGLCHIFDWTDPKQLDSYFWLHEPFEQQGIDSWWLDWCCDPSTANAPGLTPDTFINWRYAERRRAPGSRWPAFQRIGGSFQSGFGGADGNGAFAEHRSTIQFTGDTCGSWDLLRFASEFTAAENSIGMPYVSHDIGTFHSVSPVGLCDAAASPPATPRLNALPPDMYARWVQLGAFQPLLRLHSSHGERLPWEYPGKAGEVAAEFLRLREALVPYLYTLARQAHDSGLPIVRALYLSWPEQANAYDPAFAHQYTLGRDILVSPVVAPGDPASATVWLPPGKWIDFFTGRQLQGPRTIELDVPLGRMPVYVRGGAILPTQPYAATTPAGSAKELILTAFHGARRGRTTVYDDAGTGLGYLEGEFGRISVRQRRLGNRLVVVIGGERGDFAGMPAKRAYEVRVTGLRREPVAMEVGNAPLGAAAWTYDGQSRTLVADIGRRSARHRTAITVLLPRR